MPSTLPTSLRSFTTVPRIHRAIVLVKPPNFCRACQLAQPILSRIRSRLRRSRLLPVLSLLPSPSLYPILPRARKFITPPSDRLPRPPPLSIPHRSPSVRQPPSKPLLPPRACPTATFPR